MYDNRKAIVIYSCNGQGAKETNATVEAIFINEKMKAR
jgi:hypothetical protein